MRPWRLHRRRGHRLAVVLLAGGTAPCRATAAHRDRHRLQSVKGDRLLCQPVTLACSGIRLWCCCCCKTCVTLPSGWVIDEPFSEQQWVVGPHARWSSHRIALAPV